MREKLAELCHEQWSGWMKYLFSKCENMTGNYDNKNRELVLTATIPEWACQRWSRQMQTKYFDLSEEEKESDREEADRFLALIEQNQHSVQQPLHAIETAHSGERCIKFFAL